MNRLMKTCLAFLLAAAASAAGALEAEAQVKVRKPQPKPGRALSPLVAASVDEALEKAASRGFPLIVAVGIVGDGQIPPLFENPAVARASRIAVGLASTDYVPDVEFFRTRKFDGRKVPCYLVLDSRGNVLEVHPEKTDPGVLVASARSAAKVAEGVVEEVGRVVQRAEELASAGDEKGLLELARPWLARHLRGHPELDRIRELVTASGEPRLAAIPEGDPAETRRSLEALAREYAHSPVEAEALVRVARLLEDPFKNRDESKKLLKHVVEELPWPENAEAHARAKTVLAGYRRDEIRRRTEEIERKKKEKEAGK